MADMGSAPLQVHPEGGEGGRIAQVSCCGRARDAAVLVEDLIC